MPLTEEKFVNNKTLYLIDWGSYSVLIFKEDGIQKFRVRVNAIRVNQSPTSLKLSSVMLHWTGVDDDYEIWLFENQFSKENQIVEYATWENGLLTLNELVEHKFTNYLEMFEEVYKTLPKRPTKFHRWYSIES